MPNAEAISGDEDEAPWPPHQELTTECPVCAAPPGFACVRKGTRWYRAPELARPHAARAEAQRVANLGVSFVLWRPVSALGWELRTYMAKGTIVRALLSERCDGVLLNEDGHRILEGRVTRVAATDAYCVLARRHVPLEEILWLGRPYFNHPAASDPRDPLEKEEKHVANG